MTKNIYNPMSKEFQDECERLGLTGRQLTLKYKKEGKFLEKDEVYKNGHSKQKYTKKQLLDILVQFNEDNKKPPTEADFNIGDQRYPSSNTYIRHFGSWSAALKLVELDVESMVKKGVVETDQQKARLSEMIIRDHYKTHPKDLAGENCKSPCDGICPNGKTYDVKSSKLHKDTFYKFDTNNKYKEEIEIYYLLGFNEDYTKLNYGWRIPGEIAEKDVFLVGLKSRAKFTVRNMEEYDITEELREVLNKYEFCK